MQYPVSQKPHCLKKNEICVCSAQSFQVSTPYFFFDKLGICVWSVQVFRYTYAEKNMSCFVCGMCRSVGRPQHLFFYKLVWRYTYH